MNNIKASSALKTADSNKSRQRGSVSKSSLSIMKHVKGFGSIIDTSSKYWKETFNRNLCQCSIDTDEIIKEEIKTKRETAKLFKVSLSDSKKVFTKEWTEQELESLLFNYYNLKIRNWTKLSQLIITKSPKQCCYKIKKIEEKAKMNNFTRQDDINLIHLVDTMGKNWVSIAQFFPGFAPSDLEERYTNKLDPTLKRTKFSSDEDEKILLLYSKHGNNWKEIASAFPDRNANMIKNRFYSFLKKKYNIKGPNNYSSNNSNNSYIESTSLLLSGNSIIDDALNSEDTLRFRYNTDDSAMYVDTFNNKKRIELKMNNLIIKEENNNDVVMDTLDGFVETYNRIFPDEMKKNDFSDSGSGNNIMLGSMKVSSNSDEDNASSNSLLHEQNEKLLNESKHLEEILQQIDALHINSKMNEMYKNNKEYNKLTTKKEKLKEWRKDLIERMESMKRDKKKMIETNEVMMRLIKVAKSELMISKRINEFGVNSNNNIDFDLEMENI